MKRVFTVKIAFDLNEFDDALLTKNYVESVLRRHISGVGVQIDVTDVNEQEEQQDIQKKCVGGKHV